MLEKREEVECGFEVPDMAGACVRDQSKWVLFGKLTSHGNPLGKGIKDIAEGFLELLSGVRQIEVFGQQGKVLVTGVLTPLVVVGALVRPDLFTKGFHALPFTAGEGLQFFAGAKSYQNVPKIEKKVGYRPRHGGNLHKT